MDQSPLAQLPVEIRIIMFEYAVEDSEANEVFLYHAPGDPEGDYWRMRLGKSKTQWLHLMKTCKQLYAEVRPLYFSINEWCFTTINLRIVDEAPDDEAIWIAMVEDRLSKVPKENAKDMRYITINAHTTPQSGRGPAPPEQEIWCRYNRYRKFVALLPCPNAKFFAHLGVVICPILKPLTRHPGRSRPLLHKDYDLLGLALPMWSLSALNEVLEESASEVQALFSQARHMVDSSSIIDLDANLYLERLDRRWKGQHEMLKQLIR